MKLILQKIFNALLKILGLLIAILINWGLGAIILVFTIIVSALVFLLSGWSGLKIFYETLPEQLKKNLEKQ
jgi:hypothetical protein